MGLGLLFDFVFLTGDVFDFRLEFPYLHGLFAEDLDLFLVLDLVFSHFLAKGFKLFLVVLAAGFHLDELAGLSLELTGPFVFLEELLSDPSEFISADLCTTLSESELVFQHSDLLGELTRSLRLLLVER